MPAGKQNVYLYCLLIHLILKSNFVHLSHNTKLIPSLEDHYIFYPFKFWSWLFAFYCVPSNLLESILYPQLCSELNKHLNIYKHTITFIIHVKNTRYKPTNFVQTRRIRKKISTFETYSSLRVICKTGDWLHIYTISIWYVIIKWIRT